MARIFDLQRFSIHDGPGIRTTIFLKGCPLRCAWCQNPEGLEWAIRLWHFSHLCARCGACVESCPQQALTLGAEGVGVDHAACNRCGRCVDACPYNALSFDGREITVDEAVAQLAADRLFYERSGGGVTFSGGEPLLQADFIAAVARQLKSLGIHTAVETSLFAKWESIEELLQVVDLFIVDLKLSDPGRHAEFTGQDNAPIMANARRLAAELAGQGRLRFRVPLIPGFTAEPGNLANVARVAASIDPVVPVQLMNFNPLAAAKYQRMHETYALSGQAAGFTDREMSEFRSVFSEQGLNLW